MITACVALGSNLQEPAQQLLEAVAALQGLEDSRLTRCSRVYRSTAVGPGEQPDYLNAAVMLETRLTPLALLDALQRIEARQGRERELRWGPRTLDLDLLLYGDQTLNLPRLQIPHPRIAERDFVLYPLADLLPADCELPGLGPLTALLAARPGADLQVVDLQLPEEHCR
ncbi:MAG: 2-amino-4-hydroxy-6-hydroxymethyldihydropteridine diphosphokinase [Haliea sp.]|nr:2-amino-4-hydroxy-6-hydroxymethyldihydropteridine diphosphokinase [Haliea sp.]